MTGTAQPLGFPAVWLRHNCPCPDCRDPVTGQRLVAITAIPETIGVTATAQAAGTVGVTFTDGHRSAFSQDWLAANALPPAGGGTAAGPDPRTEDGKVLWRAADLPRLPAAGWPAYRDDRAVRERCLDSVARHGVVLLRDVPVSPGMVLAVARTFGFVRETNYGPLFDVRAVAGPANLAFTSAAIPPHTDNPYRDPVPTVQLLHCLRDAATGGETGLVDGFAAAAALRAEAPREFGVLTRTPWPFAYTDGTTRLRASQPLISLSPRGEITGVRLNGRSMQPLRLPGPETEAAYAAYRVWARLLARPEFMLTLRLAPGDCLVFDNTRILHARTAFPAAPDGAPAGAGERHLQGCYADLDGLLSALEVLRAG